MGGAAAHGIFAVEGPVWAGTAESSGTEVVVQVGPEAIRPGRVHFRVTASEAPVVSADLVSRSMPNHGIVRVSVIDGAPYGMPWFLIDTEVPMAGEWVLYVNLDEAGDDTAEFPFEAPAWPEP